MTTPASAPHRPSDSSDGALFDAAATEQSIIWGYGMVSAHTTRNVNRLVTDSLALHRDHRDAAIKLLTSRSVTPPLAAAAYEMPGAINTPEDAARAAVQMEQNAAVAWRAVVEKTSNNDDRTLAVNALIESAVLAARWRRVLSITPSAVPFPGGSENYSGA